MEVVIDTNVILHGRKATDIQRMYTVPEVEKELKSSEANRREQNLDLSIQRPGKECLRKVKEESNKINSPTSDNDEKLVALALTLGKTLVTDDKAMQNLALRLDIDFSGYMEEKIEETREWKKICVNCGKQVSSPPCPHCGHQNLTRKTS